MVVTEAGDTASSRGQLHAGNQPRRADPLEHLLAQGALRLGQRRNQRADALAGACSVVFLHLRHYFFGPRTKIYRISWVHGLISAASRQSLVILLGISSFAHDFYFDN